MTGIVGSVVSENQRECEERPPGVFEKRESRNL